MLNTKVSTVTANAEADAVGALCNGGYLRVYGGAQPDDCDTKAVTQALAVLRFSSPAFHPANIGVIESSPLTPDLATAGGGAPTWFRVFQADGTTPVFDGSVGTADCNLNIQANNGIPIVVHPGGEFNVKSITYRINRS